MKLLIGIY